MKNRLHIFGTSLLCAMLAGASVSDANLILNGGFVTASAGGAAIAQELDVPSSTSTYLANWTSTGYSFLFLPGTNAAGGSHSVQYNNNLALWSSSNGGLNNSWNGQGPTTIMGMDPSVGGLLCTLLNVPDMKTPIVPRPGPTPAPAK